MLERTGQRGGGERPRERGQGKTFQGRESNCYHKRCEELTCWVEEPVWYLGQRDLDFLTFCLQSAALGKLSNHLSVTCGSLCSF